jgi:hypothetical protein
MDEEGFVDTVRESRATELDRLGSEKALIAETAASLEPADVLAAAAAAERRAQRTFEAWAENEADGPAHEAFVDAAERERDHYERVVAELDDPPTAPEPDALHGYLRGLDGAVERVAAGMVGRPLASARTLLQVVNFFVNEADRARADLFRELRSDTEAMPAVGAALLAELCESEDDWTRAREAAEAAVDAVYGEYVERLESMGLDPKPVC